MNNSLSGRDRQDFIIIMKAKYRFETMTRGKIVSTQGTGPLEARLPGTH